MPNSKRFSGILPAVFLFCAIFLSLAGICAAQTNIYEIPIPIGLDSVPWGIAYGQDGAYWFTVQEPARIGRIDTVSNGYSQINITNNTGAYPFDIVRGPDSNLWFTEITDSVVARLNPFTTNYIEYNLRNPSAEPTSILVGPDGNIWFVEYGLSRIASISTTPTTNAQGFVNFLSESVPIHTNSDITSICVGPDSNIWFTEQSWGRIGYMSPANVSNYVEFFLPNTNCEPLKIVAGPDGALWFTEFNSSIWFDEVRASKIGRITTNGLVSEFVLPNSLDLRLEPYGILLGPDGNIWFTEFNNGAVGNITTNGIITVYPTPSILSFPTVLATGSPNAGSNAYDTNIWFGERRTPGLTLQALGVLNPSEALNLSAPNSTNFTSGTTFSGQLATFQNSDATNTVVVWWGDGTSNAVIITNSSVTTAPLSVTNVVSINTNGANGTYEIYGLHGYQMASNYLVTLTVTDSSNNMALANITLPPDPYYTTPPAPFFNGEVELGNRVDYLQFYNNSIFGYYSLDFFPWVYHFEMGFEYFVDAQDTHGGAYLYDNTSGHWFYTSQKLFPYLYDFTLGAWLYYYPNANSPGHYTTNPRYFYNFGTGQIITQ